MNSLTFVTLWVSLICLGLAIVLWIAAIWTGDGRLAGTGGILMIPCVVAAIVTGINWDER